MNLLAVSHDRQALEDQLKANKVVAISAGSRNIENLAVGGVAHAINLDNYADAQHGKAGS